MKKTRLLLFLLGLSSTGYCQMDFYCGRNELKTDSMTRAWYPFQVIDSLKFPNTSSFVIADIKNKPFKFISSKEMTMRSLASKEPESKAFFKKYDSDGFKNYRAYLTKLDKESKYWDSLAVAEHEYANNMPMAIWIQNSSSDTITLPSQDGSLIALLEAVDSDGNWSPIEYWWFSWCGNSYLNLILPPNHSIQLGVNNQLGEVSTQMRLKIHGRDSFYISNAFPGKVSKENFFLPASEKLERMTEGDRISFLDSVHRQLTLPPPPPDIWVAPVEEN